jgi:hypothetical protein
MKLAIIVLLVAAAHSATVVRMACGGPGGTDAANNVWTADSGTGGGAVWTVANQPALASQPIPYRSLCYSFGTSSFSRTLTVPAGNYSVTLKMLEPNKTAAGQRVFGATINGVPVLSGLDLFAMAPAALKPYDRTYQVMAPAGVIQITLTASLGNAVLSAIQIDDVPFVPPVWIPPTCTFASPPATPQNGQACIFTDVSATMSCSGGGVGQETCRWNGQKWASMGGPVEDSMFSIPIASAGFVQCVSGQISSSVLTSSVQSQEVPLFTVNGSTRWDRVIISETQQFPNNLGLTVSAGRPGGLTDMELTGASVPLGVSSGDSKPWESRPVSPQLSGLYQVVLNFSVADGHAVSEASGSGSLHWEACAYRMGVPVAATHLAGLQSCSGSAISPPSPNNPTWNSNMAYLVGSIVNFGAASWLSLQPTNVGNQPDIWPQWWRTVKSDCAGMWQAQIARADGTILPIVGTAMTSTPSSVVWTAAQ